MSLFQHFRISSKWDKALWEKWCPDLPIECFKIDRYLTFFWYIWQIICAEYDKTPLKPTWVVKGIIWCLDCMHVQRENCMYSFHLKHGGRDDVPPLVIEAGSECKLFLQHYEISHIGALNELNIWDLSHTNLFWIEHFLNMDLDFNLDGKQFIKLYF